MDHVNLLRILNLASAALMALSFVIVLVALGGTSALLLATQQPGPELWVALLPTLVLDAVILVFIAVTGALYVIAALRLRHDKGRSLQTLLALIAVLNCPLGTLYAGYALWVCWIDAASVARFEAAQAGS